MSQNDVPNSFSIDCIISQTSSDRPCQNKSFNCTAYALNACNSLMYGVIRPINQSISLLSDNLLDFNAGDTRSKPIASRAVFAPALLCTSNQFRKFSQS